MTTRTSLKSIRRPITCCYEHTILRFYDWMITKKEQIALVIDEYGGMEGHSYAGGCD